MKIGSVNTSPVTDSTSIMDAQVESYKPVQRSLSRLPSLRTDLTDIVN